MAMAEQMPNDIGRSLDGSRDYLGVIQAPFRPTRDHVRISNQGGKDQQLQQRVAPLGLLQGRRLAQSNEPESSTDAPEMFPALSRMNSIASPEAGWENTESLSVKSSMTSPRGG